LGIEWQGCGLGEVKAALIGVAEILVGGDRTIKNYGTAHLD